jgi:hypothetical protein
VAEPKGVGDWAVSEPKGAGSIRVWTQGGLGQCSDPRELVFGSFNAWTQGVWVLPSSDPMGLGPSVSKPKGVGVWVLRCPDPRGLGPSEFGPKGVGGWAEWELKGVMGWNCVQIQWGCVCARILGGWCLGPSIAGPKGVGSFRVQTQGGWVHLCPDPKGLVFGSFGVRTKRGLGWSLSGPKRGWGVGLCLDPKGLEFGFFDVRPKGFGVGSFHSEPKLVWGLGRVQTQGR